MIIYQEFLSDHAGFSWYAFSDRERRAAHAREAALLPRQATAQRGVLEQGPMSADDTSSGVRLDHVALAVRDLATVQKAYEAAGYLCGDLGEFPSENTREIYIESRPVRILLQEPLSDAGPIARHLARRGPGVHHLGLQVPDLGAYLDGLAGTGWYFTSSTFKLIRQIGTAWLVRPAEGLLVHVSQARREPEPDGPPPTIHRVLLASTNPEASNRYLKSLGIANVHVDAAPQAGLLLNPPLPPYLPLLP